MASAAAERDRRGRRSGSPARSSRSRRAARRSCAAGVGRRRVAASTRERRGDRAHADDRRRRRRRSRSASSSPRASRARRWPTASSPSREIAQRKRQRERRRSRGDAYRAATQAAKSPPRFGARTQRDLEGFLFPATYEFLRQTTATAARRRPARARSARTGRKVDLALRALEEPDAVRRADHRVDDREGGVAPDERPLIAAVIYNRLHARMPLGIDATLRYGLDIPPTESLAQSQLESDARTTRASDRACRRRRSRTRASPRCRRPRIRRRSTTSTSCASRTRCTTSSPRAIDGVLRDFLRENGYGCRDRGATRLVALLGHPVAHSLSPRMQNAAFAARGLDWAYVGASTSTGAGSRRRCAGSRRSASPART